MIINTVRGVSDSRVGIRKSGTPRKGAHAKRMLCQKFGERERERGREGGRAVPQQNTRQYIDFVTLSSLF